MSELAERFETHDPGEKLVAEKIRCDACPVMCYIADGRTGACDRYGNVGGRIVRMDPLTILDHAAETNANLFLVEICCDEFLLDRFAQKPNEPVLGVLFDRSKHNSKRNDGEIHPRRSPV